MGNYTESSLISNVEQNETTYNTNHSSYEIGKDYGRLEKKYDEINKKQDIIQKEIQDLKNEFSEKKDKDKRFKKYIIKISIIFIIFNLILIIFFIYSYFQILNKVIDSIIALFLEKNDFILTLKENIIKIVLLIFVGIIPSLLNFACLKELPQFYKNFINLFNEKNSN